MKHFTTLIPFALSTIATALNVYADDVTTVAPIVVTAARQAQPVSQSVGDITLITRQDLANFDGEMLSDVLQAQPGVQISTNGGPGQPASVFLRGATAQQTLLLIDGVRYSSATVGSASVQFIPADQIDHIEILRGPAASMYGADAIGGVIQIFTRKDATSSAELGIGNDGQRNANLFLSGKQDDTQYTLGLASTRTNGVSAVVNPTAFGYNPDLDGYRNESVSATVQSRINANTTLGVSALYAYQHDQYDSAIFDTNYNEVAQSYNYRSQGTQGGSNIWLHEEVNPIWQFKLQAGTSIDQSQDFNPLSATDYTDQKSSINTHQSQYSWQNDIKAGMGMLTLGIERLDQHVDVTNNQPYMVSERTVNGMLAGYLAHVDDITLQANVRRDDNSQYGNHTSGSAGINWQALPDWAVGGSASTGFRAPTFNELYYPGFGNPDLKPETARNREIFARYQAGSLSASLTLFKNDISDLLEYDPATYTTDNIGQASIKGFTLQADWRDNFWQAGGHYDQLDARDTANDGNNGNQLPRRAPHSGEFYLGAHQDQWQARIELQGQGSRFDDPANQTPLAGYTLTNISATWNIDKTWQLGVRVNNVFDRSYQLTAGYGELGRMGLLTLRWRGQ